jgi:hypothetical protein
MVEVGVRETKLMYVCCFHFLGILSVTFMVSFVWVAWFSFIISTVVERWVHLGLSNGSSLGGEWFGLVLISIGAEIPGM